MKNFCRAFVAAITLAMPSAASGWSARIAPSELVLDYLNGKRFTCVTDFAQLVKFEEDRFVTLELPDNQSDLRPKPVAERTTHLDFADLRGNVVRVRTGRRGGDMSVKAVWVSAGAVHIALGAGNDGLLLSLPVGYAKAESGNEVEPAKRLLMALNVGVGVFFSRLQVLMTAVCEEDAATSERDDDPSHQ